MSDNYTLVIPSNLLYLLNIWDPNLRFQKIIAEGAKSIESSTLEFNWGEVKERINRTATVKYQMDEGEKTISWLYDQIKQHVPCVSVKELTYVENDCLFGPSYPKSCRLKFGLTSVEPGVWNRFVQNGSFPMKDLYELGEAIKNSIKDIPNEIRDRYRPSFLILIETYPKDLKEDGSCIYALQRRKPGDSYMIFMRETEALWNLRDYDMKPRGGPK